MPKCTKCFEDKEQEAFVKSTTNKSGYRGCCKACFNAYYAQRRIEKYDQVRSYDKKFHFQRRLKYEYNMTEQDLEQLKEKQNNRCAICKEETKLVIDHCHNKGHVRGLLCSRCNTGLGQFRDNPEFLIAASLYVKDNE